MRTNSSPFGLSPAACALWAKSGDENGWLSLPQHMLDSAGVVRHLWDEWAAPSVTSAISRLSGLEHDEAGRLLVWLAGVHDCGKATINFQMQLAPRADGAPFVARLHTSGLPLRPPVLERGRQRFPHALASRAILTPWLEESGLGPGVARSLADIVDAHHGIPSRRPERETARGIVESYAPEWRAVHRELIGLVTDYSGVRDVLPHLSHRLGGPVQTLMSGLVIMADWIASGADLFPMSMTGMAAATWQEHAERVLVGVRAADLTAPWVPNISGAASSNDVNDLMRQRFAWSSGWAPRPVQAAIAEACADVEGSTMLIVEAPTGEGKTEAALIAAEQLAHTSGAGGAIFAAPTMSTANGLFDRVTDWAARSTEVGEITTMHLAHSKNLLNRHFTQLKYRGIGSDDPGDHGAVVASAWLTGRKKGLLSNFTVATVDQVLLMALQGKHSMLRHLGLAGKVVVIDEVHAYDAYMSQYLQTALRWLSTYGTPVVLLSATLPLAQKRELIDAYRQARPQGASRRRARQEAAPEPLSTAYPLITTVSNGKIREIDVRARADDPYIRLQLIGDETDVLAQKVCELLTDGGCALVLCNTVKRAQEAFQRLEAVLPDDVELHHAAFTARDRAVKEEQLLHRLGPQAHRGTGRPERSVVVATQVAEQSLDIDVDVLITDIAPADLLVQRMGRLHRHTRPESDRPHGLRSPQVLVRGVLCTDPVPVFDQGTSAIYDERLLLATLALVLGQLVPRGFHRPSDVPELVQTAYSAEPQIPADWQLLWDEAVVASDAARSRAQRRANTFRFPAPNAAASLDDLFSARDHDDSTDRGEAAGLAQVRDSDPTVEVIPIIAGDGVYTMLPWSDGAGEELFDTIPPLQAPARVLAESTVRLPSRLTRAPERFDAVLDTLEAGTPIGWSGAPMLNGQLALRLDQDLTATLDGHTLTYSPSLGLMVDTSNVSPSPYRLDSHPQAPKER